MAKREPLVVRRKRANRTMSPELELSVLVRNKLGIEADSAKLRDFIANQFYIISILCHEIHDAAQRDNPNAYS